MSGYTDASDATVTATDIPSILPFTKLTGMPLNPAGRYLLDGSLGEDDLLLNRRVGGGAALVPIGVPAIGNLGTNVGQTAAFDTGIVEAEAMTFIVVSNGYASGYEMLINSGDNAYADAGPTQVGLWRGGGTSTLRVNARNGAGAATTLASAFSAGRAEAAKFNINIGAFDTTEMVVGYGEDGNYYQEATGAISGRTVSNPARTIRIGIGAASQYFTQQNKVALVEVHTVKMTATQRMAAVAAARAYFALASINTL